MRNFILIKSINRRRYNSSERYIIGHDSKGDIVVSVGKVIRYASFNENVDDFSVVEETSKSEYVAKTLYKNKKGVYYKVGSSKYYLSELEKDLLNDYLSKWKCDDNNKCIPYTYNDIKEE